MQNFLDLFLELGKLKTLKRSGWVVEGIENAESIAEHSFRTASITLILASEKKDLDVNKCIKMALIHDIAESQIGDVLVDWKTKNHKGKMENSANKYHGITQEEKKKIETEAMKNLLSSNSTLYGLWLELEEQKTKEAIFAKSVDKLEMLIQAFEYEKYQKKDLSHWFDDERNYPKDPFVFEIFKQLISLRKG